MNIGYKILSFFSHYFEEFVYANVAIFSLALGLTIINQLKRRPMEQNIRSFTETIIGTTMICLLLFGSALTITIWWNNYNSPFINFDLHDEISTNVDWVDEDLTVYIVNENELLGVKANGTGQHSVFTSDEKIRDFQFSPDGRYMLIATYKKLFLFDRDSTEQQLIDAVDLDKQNKNLKGTISGIRWAPNSRYFVYELARWSKYGSKDEIFVYDLEDGSRQTISSPKRKLSTLYWSMDSQSLYYLKSDSQELDEREIIYKIKIYRIDIDDYKIDFVADIRTDDSKFPQHHFDMLGIDLYQPEDILTFGRVGEIGILKSPKGAEVGIDSRHFFYYKAGWFRKRLFKVSRDVDTSKKPTMLNTYGEHILRQIRWTPSGDYVIMDHPYWGILVLDPKKRKIGQLYPYEVSAYGWFSKK